MTGAEPGGTALVVVDLQNDFCVGPAGLARFGKDTAVLERAVAAVSGRWPGRASTAWRCSSCASSAIPDTRGRGWRLRDRTLGKRPKCLEGSWGARFHAVVPAPGERVFTKRACFDAFLSDGFEEHLRARDVSHLVLAGLYADVCVDTTARTAFQKGWHVTVLTDCTAALHLPYDAVLRFMRLVYGARTTTADDPRVWAAPVYRPEEASCVRPPD
ncbi:cysteine hydrolase family protein [Streptomyces nogalater]